MENPYRVTSVRSQKTADGSDERQMFHAGPNCLELGLPKIKTSASPPDNTGYTQKALLLLLRTNNLIIRAKNEGISGQRKITVGVTHGLSLTQRYYVL